MLIAIVIAATATKRKVKIKRIDPAVFSKFSRGVQLRVAKQEQLSIAWKYGKQSLTPKLSLPLIQNIYSIIIHIFPQSTGPPMDLLTQLVCEIHNSWKKKIELKKSLRYFDRVRSMVLTWNPRFTILSAIFWEESKGVQMNSDVDKLYPGIYKGGAFVHVCHEARAILIDVCRSTEFKI